MDLAIPNHTPHSRRLKKLGNLRFRRLTTHVPIHLLIDSTGLRIHVGRLRKPPKRRVWRKLHLAVEGGTGEILAAELTNRRTADCARVPNLLNRIDHREWYAGSGYSRRSLVKNAVFRYKSILGRRMRSRSLSNQRVEVQLAAKILNTMTSLGRPDSVKVE